MKTTKISTLIFTLIFFCVGSVYALPITYTIQGNVSYGSPSSSEYAETIGTLSGYLIFDDNIISDTVWTGSNPSIVYRRHVVYNISEYSITSSGAGGEVTYDGVEGRLGVMYNPIDSMDPDTGYTVEGIDNTFLYSDNITILYDGAFDEYDYFELGEQFEIYSVAACAMLGNVFSLSYPEEYQFNSPIPLYNYYIKATPVPEPTTMLLFGLGLLGVAGISRRKK